MGKYFAHNRPHTREDFRMAPPAMNSGSLSPLNPGRTEHRAPPFRGTPSTSRGSPLPKHYIDLGEGEYSRVSPASAEMQKYQRYSRYARNVSKFSKFMTSAAYMAAYLAGEWAGEEFAKQLSSVSAPVDYPFGDLPSGWTTVCSVDPQARPLEPSRKIGIIPGSPALGSTACSVSTINQANLGPGSSLPGGLTRLVLVQSSSASPWPNRNGRPYFIASHPASPASEPLTNGKQTRTMPMPIGIPEPFDFAETGVDYKTATPAGWGFTQAINFKFPPKGPPTKVTEPYRDSTPPPRTRERKWKLGKGGVAGDVFGALTELGDAMDCAVQAAKKHGGPTHGFAKTTGHRRHRGQKSKGFFNKAKYIRDNFDVGNAGMVMDFLKCMAANEITDRAFGTLSSKAGKAFGEATGSPRGPGIKRAPPPPFSF